MDKKEGKSPCLLLLDPDFEHGRHLQGLLSSHDLQVTWLTKHLSGLALSDDHYFPLVLATVEGQDIDGMEFCALWRQRQSRRKTPVSRIVLIGHDRDREQLADLDPGMDDYLIEPCLDAEVVWRVKRNMQSHYDFQAQDRISNNQGDILTGHDLHPVLIKEFSRSGRQSDSIGLVVIKVQGWPLLAMDYGQAGAQMVEDIIIHRIQSLVRTYDSFFCIEQGRYIVLLPHTSQEGTTGFMQRIGHLLSNILSSEAFAQNELESIHLEGICAQTDVQSMPQTGAIDQLYSFVLQKAANNTFGPSFVAMHLGAEGIQMQNDTRQG